MKKSVKYTAVAAMMLFCAASPAFADSGIRIRNLASEQNIVEISTAHRYLMLPIQDNAPEGKVFIVDGNACHAGPVMNIRLARERVDYHVPVDLSAFIGRSVKIDVQGVPAGSICWKHISMSDTFEAPDGGRWRPAIHHTPPYGWMNDPNGMFFKDGEYHLYYQHNPYGSTWGNMHWGHSVSTDLIHWRHEPVAIAPDAWGTVFSGSCVVDYENTAGFGEGAVVALYTSSKATQWGDVQTQSIAYSADGGRTFTKYAGNPVLTSSEKDFRDPKVFWYAPGKHWVMILAVGQKMQIFNSPDLKQWKHVSDFGLKHGAHGGVWECPDLFELPVQGTDRKKWVLICNVNPGGPFGGSAAQYFVGTFNGKEFVNESPAVTKWLDWGKDNYATVTWHNVKDRTVALGWMSNWQYQAVLPESRFRGSNTIPRELSLYEEDGETYIAAVPVRELEEASVEVLEKDNFNVSGRDVVVDGFADKDAGAYLIDIVIRPGRTGQVEFSLMNSKDEKADFKYDVEKGLFMMDRSASGKTDFSVNFPAFTVAPAENSGELVLKILVDRASIEVFGNGGKFAMTNIVYPSEPYDRLVFGGTYGNYTVKSLYVHSIL